MPVKICFKSKKSDRLSESDYSLKDEAEIYDRTLKDVYANPRYYLDNLEFMRSYRVSWDNYALLNKGRHSAVLPYSFVKTAEKTDSFINK